MDFAPVHPLDAPVPIPAPRKVERDRLLRLRVLADISSHICLRVLNLVAQQDLVPHAIDYVRGQRVLVIDVIVDDPGTARAETLLHRIAGMVEVRQARLYAGARKIFPTCGGIFPHP